MTAEETDSKTPVTPKSPNSSFETNSENYHSVFSAQSPKLECSKKEEVGPGFEDLSVSSEKEDCLVESVVFYCKLPKAFFRSENLSTSRWGSVGMVQEKLGFSVAQIDGVFSAKTKQAILDYQKKQGQIESGCIDSHLWSSLSLSSPPDYQQRAYDLTFTMEGTDYDEIEFNYGTNDSSGMTWGPLGMTLESGEIQNILTIALKKDEDSIRQAIGQNGVANLKKVATAKNIESVRPLATKGMRDAFKKLASLESIRTAYDQVAKNAIFSKMSQYEKFLSGFPLVTELDWAFFFDVSVQTGNTKSKIEKLQKVSKNLPKDLKKRRKVWGDAIADSVKSCWKKDRQKRNQVYYEWEYVTTAYGLEEREIK